MSTSLRISGSVVIKGLMLLLLCGAAGCSLSATSPGQDFEPITGGSGDLFIRGTLDLPADAREGVFAHLRAYNRPLEIENFATSQEFQFFRSIHLGEIPYRGRRAWQFTIRQETDSNLCFAEQTWTLLGWLSSDPKANVPKTGEKYSLFHLQLEACDECPSGQFCRFGTAVRPHLNLTQQAP